MSAIRRGARPADRFTMVSNGLARDERLSFKARGLALYLLSHTEGWQTSIRTIAKANNVGREQVASALAELEKYGYLRRSQSRDVETGVLGEAEYLIQCEPFEDPEPPGDDRGPETRPRVTRLRSTRPHKKTSPKDNIPKKTQPSGGTPSGVTVEETEAPEEELMSTATDPAQAQLFDVETPEPPPAEARKPEGVQAVMAAYVTSWHEHNAEGEPLKADKGRIARDAKRMLTKGEATQEELVTAARELGTSTWANIGTAVKIVRRRGTGRKGGNVPARPEGHPRWEQLARAQDAEFAKASSDPEVQALLARYVQAGVA